MVRSFAVVAVSFFTFIGFSAAANAADQQPLGDASAVFDGGSGASMQGAVAGMS